MQNCLHAWLHMLQSIQGYRSDKILGRQPLQTLGQILNTLSH